MKAKEVRTRFMEVFNNKINGSNLPVTIHKILEHDEADEIVFLIKLTAFLEKDAFITTIRAIDDYMTEAYLGLTTDFMSREEFSELQFNMDCNYEKGHGIRVRFYCTNLHKYIQSLFKSEKESGWEKFHE